MKLIVEKHTSMTIDTNRERARIKKAFKDDKETCDHLNKLMDLIEAGMWKEAAQELEGKWWSGRDEKCECPRIEFVGLLHGESIFFDAYATYADLVCFMNNFPENYKVKRAI